MFNRFYYGWHQRQIWSKSKLIIWHAYWYWSCMQLPWKCSLKNCSIVHIVFDLDRLSLMHLVIFFSVNSCIAVKCAFNLLINAITFLLLCQCKWTRNCKFSWTFIVMLIQSKVIRVLNLWQKNGVFQSEIVQPLLDLTVDSNDLELVAAGEKF